MTNPVRSTHLVIIALIPHRTPVKSVLPPLLIHVGKGKPVFASTTSEHRKLQRPRGARACPVNERHRLIHHCGSHQRKPQTAQPCGAYTSY
jgi:hypothetical protein